ncbi:fatty acid desaturase [Planktomarina sp.]|nr:fatty acid desaturase [Planktomarina sp.]
MKKSEELPTIALLVGSYTAFVVLTLAAGTLPLVLIIIGLSGVIALHSSLQHEVLHGHPFGNQMLNDAAVFPALGLFVPYLRFKDTHLDHHFDPNLTDPYDDPESNYLDRQVLAQFARLMRGLVQFNTTLIGRMLIGPIIGLADFYAADVKAMWDGNRRIAISYALHLAGLVAPFVWVLTMTDLPFWAFVASAYLGMSILKIRTYLEHQAHERAASRTVIIEDRGILAFLFLNNNYHAVHHAHPRVVWHKLPKVFAERRDKFVKQNGGYVYKSYAQIFAQFLFRAKDPVAHPIWTEANRTQPKVPRP